MTGVQTCALPISFEGGDLREWGWGLGGVEGGWNDCWAGRLEKLEEMGGGFVEVRGREGICRGPIPAVRHWCFLYTSRD